MASIDGALHHGLFDATCAICGAGLTLTADKASVPGHVLHADVMCPACNRSTGVTLKGADTTSAPKVLIFSAPRGSV